MAGEGRREEVSRALAAPPPVSAASHEGVKANFTSNERMSAEVGQVMEHASQEHESQDLQPEKGEQLLQHKEQPQLSPPGLPSTPPRIPSPLGEQEEKESLLRDESNMKTVGTAPAAMREETKRVQESVISKSEPSNLVAPVSGVVPSPLVAPPPPPSDRTSPGVNKTPPPPPGLHPPVHPHMMTPSESQQILNQQKLIAAARVAASHRQYAFPPQSSGLVQLPSSLLPALPQVASHHPPPSLSQQVMDLDQARLAAIAHHTHSLQGPPVSFNPQTAHPRPLLSGHPPSINQQHLELLFNLSVFQQQQALQKTLLLQQHGQPQQLAKSNLDKMELHLDKVMATKAHHQQQQLQQLYHHAPPLSVSSKVEAQPPRATVHPYLMHAPPNIPAHLTWSRRAPVYPQAMRPNAYSHVSLPQRPPLMVSADLPSPSCYPVVECGPKPEQGQAASDLSQGSQISGASGNTLDRDQNTESLKSSSLSIKATPFIPMGRPPGLSTTDCATSSVVTAASRPSLDPPHTRKTGFPCTPAELSTSGIGRASSRGVEQPGHQAFLPTPKAPLLYNSIPRLPHPPSASTMVVMPQMMKSVTATVAAGHRKGRETQPYAVLPAQDRGLLYNARLQRHLAGGVEKGGVLAKDMMSLYTYPLASLGGEVVPVSAPAPAMGLDLPGRHLHPSQKLAKPYLYAGHMAGALHGSKSGISPCNDIMAAGVGRAAVVGSSQGMKSMQAAAAANNTMKRALLPTPAQTPLLPHHTPVSQPSWTSPLHAPGVHTTLSHTHGHGGQVIYPPEQAVSGGAATGYAAAGAVGILTAAYTQNQM